MKTRLHLLLGLCVSFVLAAPVFALDDEPTLSPTELDKLVAPIALYPDSLVALILPASTYAPDVVLAARYFANGGPQDEVARQNWAESVKSLAHYPELIKWMDENLSWTQQMGDVFATQPADVMAAVQRLRASARENGLLADTPQQRVVVEQETVYIEPAQPDVIYVPRYDPEILWLRRPYTGTFISFGIGFGVGDWLFYDCDWSQRSVFVHRRGPDWHYSPRWHHPRESVRVNVVNVWRPDPRYHRPNREWHHNPVAIIPRPIDPHGPDHRLEHVREERNRGYRNDNRDNRDVRRVEPPVRRIGPSTTPMMPSRPQPPAFAPPVPHRNDGFEGRRHEVSPATGLRPTRPAPPAQPPATGGQTGSVSPRPTTPASSGPRPASWAPRPGNQPRQDSGQSSNAPEQNQPGRPQRRM
jgi:hypothetical protein